MKKDKFTVMFVIFAVPLFYFLILILTGFKEKENLLFIGAEITDSHPQKDFITGIYNIDYFGIDPTDSGSTWSIKNNIPRYKDSLHFNSIQIWGNDRGGAFNDTLDNYKSKVNDLMTDLDASGLRVLYGRQKIDFLCNGQRLEYEAEAGNNGFSYQRRTADTISDSGRIVVHACPDNIECPETDASPRYLCDSIYENLQHSNIVADYFSEADIGNWYLKPVMRIKESDFSQNDTTKVIAIFVKNFDGSIGDTIIIRIRNFSDSSSQNYNGQYINNYTFLSNEKKLTISGDTSHLNKERSHKDINDCKIDFKIYWYGQVEVWFDKLIVDDEMGNELFNSNKMISSCYDYKIKECSTQENFDYIIVRLRKGKNISISNFPCINYVLTKMYDYLHPIQYAEARYN